MMTRVGKLFEEEKIKYGEKKLEQGKIEGIIGTVTILRNNGMEDEDILQSLMATYNVTEKFTLDCMEKERQNRLTVA